MPESLKGHGEVPVGAAKRGTRWDAVAAIVASLVGLLALVVAGYTAHIQRQQVSAQVWPYPIMASSDMSSEYMWLNKGVGPAQVKTVQVFVDGAPQKNWQAVFRTLQVEKLDYGQSTLSGNVLSGGERLNWLQFSTRESFHAFRASGSLVTLPPSCAVVERRR